MTTGFVFGMAFHSAISSPDSRHDSREFGCPNSVVRPPASRRRVVNAADLSHCYLMIKHNRSVIYYENFFNYFPIVFDTSWLSQIR